MPRSSSPRRRREPRRGALADAEGRYSIPNLRAGRYTVQVQIIGFTSQVQDNVVVTAGQTETVDFDLASQAVSIAGLEIFATRATERKTPVAFTDVDKVQLQNQLGSRDLPLVLNTTPSVYSTQQGGGAGDARVNVRGFSQRNTAVMINGVPVNDMENGWVYWSNWDGLGDAATSIQVQRGLSAVNLATPSIGGTMNVITDPTAQTSGLILKQEFGNDGFLKTTGTFSTGEMGQLAITGAVSRKTGDGAFLGTYTDAWSYYLASSFQANARNRLEFYLVGAPQTHGQNLYKLNAATIDQEFAASLDGYDTSRFRGLPGGAACLHGTGHRPLQRQDVEPEHRAGQRVVHQPAVRVGRARDGPLRPPADELPAGAGELLPQAAGQPELVLVPRERPHALDGGLLLRW